MYEFQSSIYFDPAIYFFCCFRTLFKFHKCCFKHKCTSFTTMSNGQNFAEDSNRRIFWVIYSDLIIFLSYFIKFPPNLWKYERTTFLLTYLYYIFTKVYFQKSYFLCRQSLALANGYGNIYAVICSKLGSK